MLWSQCATMFLFNSSFRMHFLKWNWLLHKLCMYLRFLVRLPGPVHWQCVSPVYPRSNGYQTILFLFIVLISTVSNLTNQPRPKSCSHDLQCVLLNVFSLKALLYLKSSALFPWIQQPGSEAFVDCSSVFDWNFIGIKSYWASSLILKNSVSPIRESVICFFNLCLLSLQREASRHLHRKCC